MGANAGGIEKVDALADDGAMAAVDGAVAGLPAAGDLAAPPGKRRSRNGVIN